MTRFGHIWREDQTSVDRQSDIEQVLSAWRTAVTEQPYFPEHPTQDENDFQAMEEYILRFYRWSSSAHEDFTCSPGPEGSTPYGAPSTSSMVVQTARCLYLSMARCAVTRGRSSQPPTLHDRKFLIRRQPEYRTTTIGTINVSHPAHWDFNTELPPSLYKYRKQLFQETEYGTAQTPRKSLAWSYLRPENGSHPPFVVVAD
ncbi:hypothetical protein CRG98_004819 [Punica granatum]|uniref:Uncharacterized protein n=1 Tax=Punica granatum TaxID=22663 RepID=A0A2I0L272_PUNGR|nr:hypothetical protein CRG98_004819 [Punica granatum]